MELFLLAIPVILLIWYVIAQYDFDDNYFLPADMTPEEQAKHDEMMLAGAAMTLMQMGMMNNSNSSSFHGG